MKLTNPEKTTVNLTKNLDLKKNVYPIQNFVANDLAGKTVIDRKDSKDLTDLKDLVDLKDQTDHKDLRALKDLIGRNELTDLKDPIDHKDLTDLKNLTDQISLQDLRALKDLIDHLEAALKTKTMYAPKVAKKIAESLTEKKAISLSRNASKVKIDLAQINQLEKTATVLSKNVSPTKTAGKMKDALKQSK